MRLRKLALAVGLATALGAEMASALGLGEIKLKSRLNQPLEAEIKLLQVRDLTPDEIKIALASREDFQRAGVDRVFFLSDLRFEVDLESSSGPLVRVSSRQPVREPFLNFLLETQWPTGRVLREYTLLLDLPVFSEDSTARPIEGARSQPAAQPSRPAERRTSTPAARSPAEEPRPRASTPSRSQVSGDSYGPVSSNDTLWEIALQIRPGREYSVHQTMLAIQRLNPEAFINGNINLLRRGQVLRIPKASDISNISLQQAVNEVAYQNNQWSGGVETTGPQLSGSSRRSDTDAQPSQVEGRLKIASGERSASQQSGRGAGEIGGDTEALQNELTTTQEELDRSRRENSDLTSRVSELEEQIETMERLLEVSSQELQALQQQAGRSDDDTDTDQASAQAAASASSATEQPASPEPTDPAESQAKLPQQDPSKVVSPAQAAKPSLLDTLLNNILYIGAALLALIVGALLLLRRREQEPEEESLDLAYTTPAVSEEKVTEADMDAAIGAGMADDFHSEDETVEDDLDLDDAIHAEPQTGDAVAEADIYIAYGKFDQAEDMLQKALQNDAGNTAARLKLMEVYLETQELQKFDQQYGQVMASDNEGAKVRADDLRDQFADAPEYHAPSMPDDSSFAGLDDEQSFELDADLDLDLDKSDLSDEDLAFDLDLDDDKTTANQDSAETNELAAEDFNLNFASDLTDSDLETDDEFAFDLDLDSEAEATDSAAATPAAAQLVDEKLVDDELSDNELADNELAEDDDFSLDFDLGEDADLVSETDSDDAFDLTLDSEADAEFELTKEPEPASETAAATPAADLSLSDDDNFDLDSAEFGDLDLDALDQEVDALSADMDLAGEEFGEDEPLLEEPLAGLDEEEPLAALDEKPSAVFDEEPSAAFDEEPLTSWDEPSAESDKEPSADSYKEPSSDADDELDLSAEFAEATSADADNQAELEEDVPTLAAAEPAAEAEEDDTPDFSSEEFDLAADLGLDEEDYSAEDYGLESNDTADSREESEDDVFSQAVSDLPTPEDVLAAGGEEEDLDAELDFLADTDEAATKLDLARAYIDMGDQDGARDILDEVVEEGNDTQKQEAQELLTRIG